MSYSSATLGDTVAEALYYVSTATPVVRDDDSGWGLPSCFDVTGFAVACFGAACAEVAELAGADGNDEVVMSRELVSRCFGLTIRPVGWALPPVWDAIAGLYETSDGWVRLHTNAVHHRRAALQVLGCDADREAVSRTVASWSAEALEEAIVDAGGCAATLNTREEWCTHPQGIAVAREPLIHWQAHPGGQDRVTGRDGPPLEGIRVLDCTRVLAGPVCTRFLAGFGAQVLRVDPPGWQEGVVEPEITLGKRLTTLDLRQSGDVAIFRELLRDADVFVHGYRADALERLGLGDDERRALNPQLIDVGLSAYGWTGPWATRRGFDSLVQMSAGIAHTGMRHASANQPVPLPAQALDQGTGYLMAASVLRALRVRATTGERLHARLSLARTAEFLSATLSSAPLLMMPEETAATLTSMREQTAWGPARRVRFPALSGCPEPRWPYPARRFHSDAPHWS